MQSSTSTAVKNPSTCFIDWNDPAKGPVLVLNVVQLAKLRFIYLGIGKITILGTVTPYSCNSRNDCPCTTK